MQLSPNFTLAEMIVSQTASRKNINNMPVDAYIRNLSKLCINVLEPIRAHFGKPVIISSGYRCDKLNKAIGGSTTSQHSYGEAADFTVQGFSNLEVCKWISKNLPFDQLIYEFGESGWIHVSYSPRMRKDVLRAVKQKKMGILKTVYLSGLV